MTCSCTPGAPPYEFMLHVSPVCPTHRFRTEEEHLISAGWARAGSGWTHPSGTLWCSQDEAYSIMLQEEKHYDERSSR